MIKFTIEETMLLLHQVWKKHSNYGLCIVPKCRKKAKTWFATGPFFVCADHLHIPENELEKFAIDRLVKLAKETLPNVVKALREVEG